MKNTRTYILCMILYGFCIHAMSNELYVDIMQHEKAGQKEIVIVIPTYNNSAWCIKNIESVLMQKYTNYRVIIVNDCSSDDTFAKLEAYLLEHPLKDKVTLITNEERRGAMANWYYTISSLPDHVIVIHLDGDDRLASEHVLTKINRAYADKRVWMTFGQFRCWPSEQVGFCKRPSANVIKANTYRRSIWCTSHLRTHYAWLFKKIRKEDFEYDGAFVFTAPDRAMMYPMLEMAAGHFYAFDEILYIYNVSNPLAESRQYLPLQQKTCKYIIGLPPYKPLADVLTTL